MIIFVSGDVSTHMSKTFRAVARYLRSGTRCWKSSQHQHDVPTIVALSAGQTVYCGSCRQMTPHFASAGYNCPQYMNPAEYFISLVNTDFDDHADVPQMVQSYTQSEIRKELINRIKSDRKTPQH
ncbi:hypothetical protein F441_09450 [Phytophthora nicotianae CJ01A1]|uniref:ABC transporter family G domain-containing protein n=3 Tax=Phytophthora nicotianae TaxID=4792 RepID=V9F4T3_PHYNI|nr:hypothetical protein F443_09505 [Phytophthora nicotianae P1569]ETP15912.1 hypothetical protein F441_09450 [Phytophthora nicotianae CJ01A1]